MFRMTWSVVLCVAGISIGAAAQVPLSGTVSDASSGPLLSGTVYHATDIVVPAGATLTVQAGAIVKFTHSSGPFVVLGELNVNGTAGNPVIFTGIEDDSAGGDTNGNGISAATPGSYQAIVFEPAATGSVTHLEARYGGAPGFTYSDDALVINGADVSLLDCHIHDYLAYGLTMNDTAADASVVNCQFDGGSTAVHDIPLANLPNFIGNTASGNTSSNSIRVTSTSLTAGMFVTLSPNNLIGGTVIVEASIVIPANAGLTVGAGCILKMNGGTAIEVNGGLLETLGTAGSPVICTVLADDSHGGDTNGDGSATLPLAGTWTGVLVNSGGSSVLTSTHTEVWYAGSPGASIPSAAGISLLDGTASLNNCAVRHSLAAGLFVGGSLQSASVVGCNFSFNASAVKTARLELLLGFSGNSASANGAHDAVEVANATVGASTAITIANLMPNRVLVCHDITVLAGATLSIGSGCILKMVPGARITAAGTLDCPGTSSNPVVFTSLFDDTQGGDTNKDGSSTVAAAGDWERIGFQTSSGASVLEHVVVRYAGAAGSPGILVETDISIIFSAVEHCAGVGIGLNQGAARPSIRNTSIQGCGGYAIGDAEWGALEGFSDNVAFGNAGDCVQVGSGIVGPSDRVQPYFAPNATIVVTSDPVFSSSSSLTLEAGVVVKATQFVDFTVNQGRFETRGTAYAPVVMTSLDDDAIGGDTRGDGPTAGSPGDWGGVALGPSAMSGLLEHLTVRYAVTGLTVDNPGVTANSIRVGYALFNGVSIQEMSGDAVNFIVHDCGVYGIDAIAGAWDLVHGTIFNCFLGGVHRAVSSSWSGMAVNSIAWLNGSGGGDNFQNFATAQLASCDGSPMAAGANGNIMADPLFIDPLTGDFRLSLTSPCLDTADMATASATRLDHLEGTRVADGALAGSALPDMGALERIPWHLEVQGSARLGTLLYMSIVGPPSSTGLLLLALPSSFAEFFPGYGYLLIGHSSQVLPLPALPVGATYPGYIPNVPALAGFSFWFQGLAVLNSNPSLGSFTERYRATITP